MVWAFGMFGACYIGLARRASESPQAAERQLIILVSASWPNSTCPNCPLQSPSGKSSGSRGSQVGIPIHPMVHRKSCHANPMPAPYTIIRRARIKPAGQPTQSSACPTRCMGSMEAMHASPLPVEPRWRTFTSSTSSLVSTTTAGGGQTCHGVRSSKVHCCLSACT